MPVSINNVESNIEVENAPGGGASASDNHEQDSQQAAQRWLTIAREQQRRAERTSAWGFDD